MIPKQAKQLLDQINMTEKKQNRWVRGFLKSVKILIEDNKILTTRQSDKLKKIYRESS